MVLLKELNQLTLVEDIQNHNPLFPDRKVVLIDLKEILKVLPLSNNNQVLLLVALISRFHLN